ncbi:SIR2 family protein [Puniceicoccus vermicola]|uniref:SIR2 family protein n=1 Tax=Puniceicoccus vermicola TaxID=388746 RepID=A0A7X1AZB7_9BACT|nr:SIR2 family protein [Puniceicoccus vermicola]MBC2602714.1 SIR2 family protein [Puniceicoccus vermicola]
MYKIIEEGNTLESLDELVHETKVTALLGSGISSWSPTSLATGASFTSAIYDLLFPTGPISDRLEIDDQFPDKIKSLPFEVILEKSPDERRIRLFLRNLYGIAKPNPLHELLAQQVKLNVISDLITTNYDTALDTALAHVSSCEGERFGSLTRVVNEPTLSDTHTRYYFKIHGSADDSNGETLIFALTQEARMSGKKAALFKSLIKNRTLLVIGYSGRDFEICPEIEKLPINRIIWLAYRREDLGIGGKRVLTRHNGTLLEGDLRYWLPLLFGEELNLQNSEISFPKERLALIFSDAELALWRVALLNHLSYAAKAAREIVEVDHHSLETAELVAEAHALRADALHKSGKYRCAARAYATALELVEDTASIETASRYLVGISDNSRMYGRLLRGAIAARRASAIAEVDFGLSAEVRQTRLLALSFMYRVFAHYRGFAWLRRAIQRIAAKRLQSQEDVLLESGAYANYHHLVLWVARFDVGNIVKISQRTYSASEGFEEIGYTLAQMQAFRAQADSRTSEWEEEARKWSELAAELGVHPEAYKLFRLRRQFRPDDAALKSAEEYHFAQCEYSPWMRFLRRRWA